MVRTVDPRRASGVQPGAEHGGHHLVEQVLVVRDPGDRRRRAEHGDPRGGPLGDTPGELPDRFDRHVRMDHESPAVAGEVRDAIEGLTVHAALGHGERRRRIARPGADVGHRSQAKGVRAVGLVGRLDAGHRRVGVAGGRADPGPVLILLDAGDAREKGDGGHVLDVEGRRRRVVGPPAAAGVRADAFGASRRRAAIGRTASASVDGDRAVMSSGVERDGCAGAGAAAGPIPVCPACRARGERRRTRRRSGSDRPRPGRMPRRRAPAAR